MRASLGLLLILALAGPARAQADAAREMEDATKAARLEHLSELVKRFEDEAKEYRDEVLRIAERKYTERRARIEGNYKRAMEPILVAERQNRLDAIAAFERFLERYPNNKSYTPDAIFRLAELYFEKYDDDHQKNMASFRDAYAVWQQKQEAAGEGFDEDANPPPAEPIPRFDRTVELYRDLIARFPDYRLVDGAYYLMGYTQRTQGDVDEGMATWLTLVEKYPDSRFYPEVWFRIGDFHFDEEQWPESIAAFSKVVPLKENAYYDKALYKLAWTYYLVNRFDESVDRFFELLDFSFAKREKEGDSGDSGGSVLEEESLQYLAISFADDSWSRPNAYKTLISGTSFEDEYADIEIDYVRFCVDYFGRVGKRPYEREVLARLGDILFKQSKNKQSILALKEAILRDPLHRDAPKLQDLVVQAYERERDFDAASRERDVLIANYSENSSWANKHIGDSDARREAKSFAKNSLYKAAIYYHQQANKYFEDNKQDLGVKAFEAAAASYSQYLERYPHDREAYELTFYLGETYYYSLQFRKAATIYTSVRDSRQGTKYKNEAALNVVYALDKVVQQEVKSGRLPDKDPFKSTGSETKLVGKSDIDPLRREYITAIDRLLEIGPPEKVAANFGYTAGAIYYAHGEYEQAMKRFNQVVDKYPSEEAAKFSGNLILNYLLAKEQWAEAAKVASRFKTTLKAADASEIAKIEGGAKFQLARKTLEDGDTAIKEGRVSEGIAMLENGANTYLALLEEDPKREFADRMLYNAALSLEKARRPAKAAELYERLYKDYPASTFAAQSMFNVASKNEQAFDFKKAIKTYKDLVKKYPESELRADAQINAALALEGQQRYKEAGRELEKFARMFPDRPEAADVFFRAAIVRKKDNDPRGEIATLKKFVKKYGRDAAQAARIVEAQVRIGDVNRELYKKARSSSARRRLDKASKTAYAAAVSAHARNPGSSTGAYFAAKAAFELAERGWRGYEKLKITGNTGKKQGKQLVAKSERLTEVEGVFKSVITTYKQAEWSLASLYRLGALYDNLQSTIVEAPCPRDIKRIDPLACDEYRNVLEDKAFAVEEKAVEAYRTAYERARDLKLNNDWTRRTLESLNRLRPEFAIDKQPLGEPTAGEVYNLGYVLPDGGARMVKPR